MMTRRNNVAMRYSSNYKHDRNTSQNCWGKWWGNLNYMQGTIAAQNG